jgi:predicted acetyltransferase
MSENVLSEEQVDRDLRLRVLSGADGWQVHLVLDNCTVSRLTIHDRRMRIGSAVVRTGGIAGVHTVPRHRRKGYSRLCMSRAITLMDAIGFDMALLFGIPDYYPRWGFATVMAEPRLTITTRRAEAAQRMPGYTIAGYNARVHAPAILRMYSRQNRLRSASLLRDPGRITKLWKGSRWDKKAQAFVVLNPSRRVCAYAAHDSSHEELLVTEVGSVSPSFFPALTAELARRAVRRRTGEISVLIPLDHPYAEYLQGWQVAHRLDFFRDGGGMARIIRLPDTLTRCSPELSRRLRSSGLGRSPFSLDLRTDIGTVTLRVRDGRVRVAPGSGGRIRVRMPQQVLTQLLLGYRSGGYAATLERVKIPARAMDLMNALFPRAFPYCWSADRF